MYLMDFLRSVDKRCIVDVYDVESGELIYQNLDKKDLCDVRNYHNVYNISAHNNHIHVTIDGNVGIIYLVGRKLREEPHVYHPGVNNAGIESELPRFEHKRKK